VKENPLEKFNSPQWRILAALSLSLLVLYSLVLLSPNPAPERYDVSYSRFFDELEGGNIKSVSIRELRLQGEFFEEIKLLVPPADKIVAVSKFQTFLPSFQGEKLIERLKEKNVTIEVDPPDETTLFWQLVMAVLPWILIIGIWVFIMRRTAQRIGGGPGGVFTFGQSKARLHDAEKPGVSFDDVAGMDNVKKELSEVVEFLINPERFKVIGAKVPKGVLLIGPPGTGKTLLARATAGEAKVPFYSINASEFVEMFVGVGAARVRDMFKKAKASKPSIIFIDEIDAVGRTRGAGLGGGSDEREQTLNQLLAEVDGFEPNEELVVMAATNRPDVLDTALLRPGRFDRHIVIERPGWKERLDILKIHIRNKKLAEDIELESVAKGTPGMTGADLENLANEAALIALRTNKEKIDMSDFDEARDKILMGTVREETISELEKRITAYHEAGHAIVAWELPGTDPIHKVSIVPRGMAMGITLLLPEEDRHYYPKSYLVSRLTVDLAGMIAEKIVFKETSSGSQNDLKEATSLAEKMVAQWGMSDKVGPINLGRGEEHPFLGRELAQPKRYSEDMASLMDQEIRKLIVDAESGAEEILKLNRKPLHDLAEALLKEETLGKAEIEQIIKSAKKQA
jgi:cell division protease FtsH